MSELCIRDMRVVHDASHSDFVPYDKLDLNGLSVPNFTLLNNFLPPPPTPQLSSSFPQLSGSGLSHSWPPQTAATQTRKRSMDLSGLSPSTLALLNIKDPKNYVPPGQHSRQSRSASESHINKKSNSEDLGLINLANRLNNAARRDKLSPPLPLPPLPFKRKRAASVERIFLQHSPTATPLTAMPASFSASASAMNNSAVQQYSHFRSHSLNSSPVMFLDSNDPDESSSSSSRGYSGACDSVDVAVGAMSTSSLHSPNIFTSKTTIIRLAPSTSTAVNLNRGASAFAMRARSESPLATVNEGKPFYKVIVGRATSLSPINMAASTVESHLDLRGRHNVTSAFAASSSTSLSLQHGDPTPLVEVSEDEEKADEEEMSKRETAHRNFSEDGLPPLPQG